MLFPNFSTFRWFDAAALKRHPLYPNAEWPRRAVSRKITLFVDLDFETTDL